MGDRAKLVLLFVGSCVFLAQTCCGEKFRLGGWIYPGVAQANPNWDPNTASPAMTYLNVGNLDFFANGSIDTHEFTDTFMRNIKRKKASNPSFEVQPIQQQQQQQQELMCCGTCKQGLDGCS